MRKFGLIGHPIEHSLSPALFKAAYGGRYPYELIQEEDFQKAYGRFLEEYDGVNVTAPFKELAFRQADIAAEECRIIGAANILLKTPGGVVAYNSDYRGVRKWLKEVAEELHKEDIKVLVVGYGGAGKAAAAAGRSLQMDVTVVNRTAKEEDIKPLSYFGQGFRESDIIIYTLPVPLKHIDMLTKEDWMGGKEPKPKYILEANYKDPCFSLSSDRMMYSIHNDKIRFVEGRLWLLYQAVTGYEIFTERTPDLKEMIKVL